MKKPYKKPKMSVKKLNSFFFVCSTNCLTIGKNGGRAGTTNCNCPT